MSRGRYAELLYKDGIAGNGSETYPYHLVPKEKLHFFSVKDGWEPLCKILGKPIPNEQFPRANDAAAVEAFFKGMILKGLLRWAQVLAIGSGILGVALYYFFS